MAFFKVGFHGEILVVILAVDTVTCKCIFNKLH